MNGKSCHLGFAVPKHLYETNNEVLSLFSNQFFVVYFDDILIYLTHLRTVLVALRDNELFLNLKKSYFFTGSFGISRVFDWFRGISVDQKKVQAVQELPELMNVHEARSFHGFVTFYKRFIKNFSTLVSTHHRLC